MKKKIIASASLLLSLTVACTHRMSKMESTRNIQSLQSQVTVFNEDPLHWIRSLQMKEYADFCRSEIQETTETLEALDFDSMDRVSLAEAGRQWLRESFKVRLKVNQSLANLDEDCKNSLIPFLRNLRQVEDYIGELSSTEPDRNAFDINFKKVKPPILDESAYSPYQLNPKYDNQSQFQFKAGDVVATRGVSFISATIGQMTSDRTHFSHGVFVHENEKGELQTIESYLQQGVEFYSLEDAMKNENTRIMVFRAKDQQLAKKASDIMGHKLRALKAAGDGIPYDYYMDHKDHSRMTCGEVIIASYEWASDGKFVIPTVQSPIRFSNPNVLKKLNITEKETFSPALMEIDPRFELVLDWRDYSLTRDQRQKDMTLKKIIEWMETKDYMLHQTLTSKALSKIWKTRDTVFWNLLRPFDLFKVPKETPESFLITVAQMKNVGEVLLKEVKKADLKFEKQSGYPMTEKRLLDYLESLMIEDEKLLKTGKKTVFYHLLSPEKKK